MTAEELLHAGDLGGALTTLQDKIRGDAGNAKLRIFLFQILCLTGDWKRAITQLKLSAEMEPLAVPMAQTYREAIICEVYREKVFAGEKEPLVFGEPQEWIAPLIEALKHDADGNAAAAADLRARAFDMAPATPGRINGQAFEWIADADMRLGPVLEVIINGRYFWMPFAAVSKITFDEPEDLRDSVWMPATVDLPNEGNMVALVPTRYAGTTGQDNDQAKLARLTEWADIGADTYAGIGQRLLATDFGDIAIMDARKLVLGPDDGHDTAADG